MLAEECEGNKTPDLAMIGFRALVNTLSSESYKTEEVITRLAYLQYRVTHQVVPQLLIQGRYGCYIGTE